MERSQEGRHGAHNHVDDLHPFVEVEERLKAIEDMKKFLESEDTNPFITAKFVPAGFEFASPQIIDLIDKKLQELKSGPKEELPESIPKVLNDNLFVEIYPFFIAHSVQNVWDFNYGDRIVNINTSKRNFVNFGEFGTVIGFTQTELVILFDNENLSLTNLYERCKAYRGAKLTPDSVINMTRHFKETKSPDRSQGTVRNFRQQAKK